MAEPTGGARSAFVLGSRFNPLRGLSLEAGLSDSTVEESTWVDRARPFVVALGAGLIYGSWALYINSGHGLDAAFRAAGAQAALSITATLTAVLFLEWVFARFSNPSAGYWVSGASTAALGGGAMAAGHYAAGTPEIIPTIAPSVVIGTTFYFVYASFLNKRVSGEHSEGSWHLKALVWLLGMLITVPLWVPVLIGYRLVVRVMKANTPPTNDKPWFINNHWLTRARFEGQTAHIDNVRSMNMEQWKNKAKLPIPEGPSPYHQQRTIDMDAIDGVYLMFSPFHVFLNFRVKTDEGHEHLVLSVEGRHQYHGAPDLGFWAYTNGSLTLYPTMTTEEDAFYRCASAGEFPYPICMYPIRDMTADALPYERRLIHRLVLLNALKRCNEVADTPETYDYFQNSCATNTMALGNLAIGGVTRRHTRKNLWLRGLASYLSRTELGMQHLLYEMNLIDRAAIDRDDAHEMDFDALHQHCDISPQLQELMAQGVKGEALSQAVRERFRSAAH